MRIPRRYKRRIVGLLRELHDIKFYVIIAMAFFLIGYFSMMIRLVYGS